jgi:23S rRNA pseudouridine1911/1915/1917 synthase
MALITRRRDGFLMAFKPLGAPTTTGINPHALTEQITAAFPEQLAIKGFKKDEGGLLYRLDTNTSGLVLFALDQSVFDRFTADSKAQLIQKHYFAYVQGKVLDERGVIDFPIGHHPRNQRKMVAQLEQSQKARSQWRPAATSYQVIEHDHLGNTWLHVTITLGSRHQIRVHCAAIGHPLVNDNLYNPQAIPELEMLLRCQRVEWPTQDQIFDLTELALTQEDAKPFPTFRF